MDLIKDSEYYRDIERQSNDAESPYAYMKGRSDDICDEALATLIGDRGEKLVLDKGLEAKLKEWLKEVWKAFMPMVQLRSWNADNACAHHGSDTFVLIYERARFDDAPYPFCGRSPEQGEANRSHAVSVLRTLAELQADDNMVLRDIYDIARTVLGRYVDFAIRLAETAFLRKDSYMYAVMDAAEALMKSLRDLMASHTDYSLLDSLHHMQNTAPTNPNFEITLKNNAENGYCRAYIYENAAYLYVPEMEILFSEVKKAFEASAALDRDCVMRKVQENRERFYRTPLADMKPASVPDWRKVLTDAADVIASIRFS